MRLVVCAVAALALAVLGVATWALVFDAEEDAGDPPGLLFSGSFESGELDPWPGAQCANTGIASDGLFERGTIQVQTDVVGEGRYAARFDLPASSARQACEVLVERTIGIGSDDYYGLMVRFPAAWQEPSPAGWGLAIAQLNFQGIWGAPVILAAHRDRVALVLQSGLCNGVDTSRPGCRYSSGASGNLAPMLAVPRPLERDRWHQLIVHVRWAANASGLVEVWHRLQGELAWVKTARLTGYPTVQWTDDQGPSALAGAVTNDKIGAYRGGADFPLTIWQDGFVRTTTFATAAAALR